MEESSFKDEKFSRFQPAEVPYTFVTMVVVPSLAGACTAPACQHCKQYNKSCGSQDHCRYSCVLTSLKFFLVPPLKEQGHFAPQRQSSPLLKETERRGQSARVLAGLELSDNEHLKVSKGYSGVSLAPCIGVTAERQYRVTHKERGPATSQSFLPVCKATTSRKGCLRAQLISLIRISCHRFLWKHAPVHVKYAFYSATRTSSKVTY